MTERIQRCLDDQMTVCSDTCSGPETVYFSGFEDGREFVLQLCPNPVKRDRTPRLIEFGGVGVDAVVIFGRKFGDEAELEQIVSRADTSTAI